MFFSLLLFLFFSFHSEFRTAINLSVSYFVMDVDEAALNPSSVKVKRRPKKMQKIEMISSGGVVYQSSVRGNRLLHYMGHKYIKNNVHGANVYWKCTKWHNGCKARAITNMTMADSCFVKNVHNHEELTAEFN